MPNPFHYRAKIDRLWRRSADHNPGYIRIKALNAIVRELFAPTPRAQLNYQAYRTTDPFDVARHLLRDLYDRSPVPAPEGSPVPAPESSSVPAPAREPAPLLTEEEPTDEDDDPL